MQTLTNTRRCSSTFGVGRVGLVLPLRLSITSALQRVLVTVETVPLLAGPSRVLVTRVLAPAVPSTVSNQAPTAVTRDLVLVVVIALRGAGRAVALLA